MTTAKPQPAPSSERPRSVGALLRTVAVLGVWSGVSAGPAAAQEAPRYSIAGEAAALAKRAALENSPYTVQTGRLKLAIEAGANFEYNDNINVADVARQQDAIFRPSVSVRGFLPVTTVNSINLSLGVSPALYLKNSEYDRVLITPGSELAFDFYLGDYLLNLHDQFSYTQDPIAVGSVSGTAVFGGFNNAAGAKVVGDYNNLVLSLGYDHVTFISSSRQFEQLNNSSENFNAHGTYQITRTFSLGLSAGGGFNNYEQAFLNDHRYFRVGADTVVAVTPRFKLTAEAGMIAYDFDRTGTVGPTPDQESYYAGLGTVHKLGQNFVHSLKGGRELQLGIASDALELWTVRYQADWKISQHMTVSPRLFFERGRELKTTGAEKYDRLGAGLALSQQLSEKLRAAIGYNFIVKDSDLALRNYRQNSVTLEVTYRF